MRGRVFGVITASVLSAVPLGVVLAGLLAETVPLSTVFLGGAVAYLAVSLIPAVHPAWTEEEMRRTAPASHDPA